MKKNPKAAFLAKVSLVGIACIGLQRLWYNNEFNHLQSTLNRVCEYYREDRPELKHPDGITRFTKDCHIYHLKPNVHRPDCDSGLKCWLSNVLSDYLYPWSFDLHVERCTDSSLSSNCELIPYDRVIHFQPSPFSKLFENHLNS